MDEEGVSGPAIGRRRLLVAGSVAAACCLAGPRAAGAAPESERPKPGDRLVVAEGEAEGRPLTLEMLPVAGPQVFAWPADPESGVVRSRSRFNKLVVVRVDPARLDERARAVAAEGALAFSAVCTHQGCVVTGWMPEDALLACPCHGSTFEAAKGGSVAGGPAKRRLAMLPLKAGEDGALTVEGAFTSKLGYA